MVEMGCCCCDTVVFVGDDEMINQKLIIMAILLAGLVLVGTAGATTIPTNISTVSNAHLFYTSHITTATLTGSTVSVTYIGPSAISAGGIECALMCPDNMGYNLSVWEGDSDKTFGVWTFQLSDINRTDLNGCFMDMINRTWVLS